jgi:alpha-galactosidase
MLETSFYYRIFEDFTQSGIKDTNSEFQYSSCKKFRAKLVFQKQGSSVLIKPTFQWADSLRPPVGFHLETIEFDLKLFAHEGSNFKVFQHGYQSWSFSRAYTASEKDVSPSLEFLRYSQENFYSQHSGEPGNFLSESFTCLYSSSTNTGYILGVLKDSDPGVRIQTILSPEGRIEGTRVLLDYHSSPDVKAGGRIPSPELIWISFQGQPEKAIAGYFDLFAQSKKWEPPKGKVPTGWCSWYYYYTGITEKIILDNLKEIKKQNLPLQFFQVDDGYQNTIGDWLKPNEKFPAGMKLIANEIRNTGYEPGIWLAPFLIRKESEFFQKYPEAVLKDESGDPVPALWNPLWGKDYTYCLDLTHPKSIEFLETTFRTITKDWGYPYLKLDFLYAGLLPGSVYDPTQTPQKRYQNVLKLIRKVVGKNVFLLGCGAPIFPSVGFFDGMRISCDVAPFWKPELKRRLVKDKNALCTEKALINDLTRASMHRKFWFNDPDCLLVRKRKNGMTGKQTKLMASVMGVSGGMLLVSDDMTRLEPERLELLKQTIELSKLCQSKSPLPLGIFQSEFPEGMYNPNGYLGVWNPTKEKKKIKLQVPVKNSSSGWIDFWTGEKIARDLEFDPKTGILEIVLEGFESQVFYVK